MSKAGRLGLIALAVVVAIAAFVIAKPGDDDDEKADTTPAAQTAKEPTATAPSAMEPPADGPDATAPQQIVLIEHAARGGAQEIKATKGQIVRFTVTSDVADDIHVHGYDIEEKVAPNKPARFSFKADIEGIFEVESHEAEHHGKDALIAELVVEPS